MLQVHEVHSYYGNIAALKGINLRVVQGEIVALLGRNGAGKTTLLNIISGFLKPRRGKVLFENERIDILDSYQVARKGISQVPEGRKIFPELTVQENLEIGSYPNWSARKKRMEKAIEIFPRLRDRLKQCGGTLSGGEQQMLAIGRALMARPSLLLLDEPSLGLSPLLVREVARIIGNINRGGVSIILIEQNARMAFKLAQRAYILEVGNIILQGDAKDLANDERVKRAYLGRRSEVIK